MADNDATVAEAIKIIADLFESLKTWGSVRHPGGAEQIKRLKELADELSDN